MLTSGPSENTVRMMRLESALISGVSPVFSVENRITGRVRDAGPDVKLAITRSSIERVNARAHAAKRAGFNKGIIMLKRTFFGFAPRSCAASSKDVSISESLARRIRLT